MPLVLCSIKLDATLNGPRPAPLRGVQMTSNNKLVNAPSPEYDGKRIVFVTEYVDKRGIFLIATVARYLISECYYIIMLVNQ